MADRAATQSSSLTLAQRSTSVRRGVGAPIAVALATVGATAALAAADPSSHTILVCPLRALTGLACPLCGCLRATAALAHGDLASAWAMNPLWVLVVPLLVAWWAAWAWRSWRGMGAWQLPQVAWQIVAVALVTFGALRNVPFLAVWLGPGS